MRSHVMYTLTSFEAQADAIVLPAIRCFRFCLNCAIMLITVSHLKGSLRSHKWTNCRKHSGAVRSRTPAGRERRGTGGRPRCRGGGGARGVQNPHPREISRAEVGVFSNASRLEAVYGHSFRISREVLILWCDNRWL